MKLNCCKFYHRENEELNAVAKKIICRYSL